MIGIFRYSDVLQQTFKEEKNEQGEVVQVPVNEYKAWPNKKKPKGMMIENLPVLPVGAFYILYLMDRKENGQTEVIDFATASWKDTKADEPVNFKFARQKKAVKKDKDYIYQVIPFADVQNPPAPKSIVKNVDIILKPSIN